MKEFLVIMLLGLAIAIALYLSEDAKLDDYQNNRLKNQDEKIEADSALLEALNSSRFSKGGVGSLPNRD